MPQPVEKPVADNARELFDRLDTTGTGQIAINALAESMKHTLGVDEDHDEFRAVVSLFDFNGDGYVSYNEFLRVFSFFEHYKAGYKAGFSKGYKQALINPVGTPMPQVTFHFREFAQMLMNDKRLSASVATYNWTNVLRPGLLKTPIHKQVELDWIEDFLAGTFSGVVTTLVGHPFDTIKVRLQTSDVTRMSDAVGKTAAAARDLSRQEGAWQVLRRTVVEEGVPGLYKGLMSPLSSVPIVNAIVFVSYEQSKRWIRRMAPVSQDPDTPLPLNYLALCGGVAGLVACGVVGPVELVRTRLQVQSAVRPLYSGSTDCVKKIVELEGVRGLFKGMVSTIARDVPAYIAQFYTYEGLKAAQVPHGKTLQDLKPHQVILAGGVGGMAGWFVTYPVDIVKSRLQVAAEGQFPRHRFLPDGGLLSASRDIYRRQGIPGFFKGLAPCLARAFPVNGCAFFAYESASQFFQRQRNVISH